MVNGISNFKNEAVDIHTKYPDLEYMSSFIGNPVIRGKLVLNDEHNMHMDTYFIRIEPVQLYPFRFPKVYEIGGRIPNNVDWHIFPDGHCCIMSIPEEIQICSNSITLAWFLEKQVKPYFFNQKFREMNGYFLHEREHDSFGNIEPFIEYFRTTDLKLIITFLHFIKKRKEPERFDKCFCGGGRRYDKCHQNSYRILNKFTNEEIDSFIIIISKYIEMKAFSL